jgi:hypothetical protein
MPAASYTDVDRLILDRWEDTQGFLEAYEDLQDRMQQILSDVEVPLERWASTHGYKSYADARSASFGIYRPNWENRRRDDALVYFALEDCAPIGYRRVKAEHPSLWFYTEGLQATKTKEADRVRFASDLRAKLGGLADEWRHDDATETEYPLGKKLSDVKDLDRVRLVSDPDDLFKFVTGALEQAFPLADAVEQTLAQLRSRD